jgi:hypothetical protein
LLASLLLENLAHIDRLPRRSNVLFLDPVTPR